MTVMTTTSIAQTNRLLRIATPLGDDELLLVALHGREAISECFCFDLEMISENAEIRAADLIAKPITVGMVNGQGCRYVNGFVNEFVLMSNEERFSRYRVRIVPWLWFLTRTTDCAIYQNKTVPEIIQAVFAARHLRDFKLNLVREYRKREYCVQYRETAFTFVMRLMEEEGISFYFQHGVNNHTLVLADEPWAHQPCPLEDHVRWEPASGPSFYREEDFVYDWARRCEVRSKRWAQSDYDFTKPHFHLSAVSPTRSAFRTPQFECYDYPGRFSTLDEAEKYTRLRMEEDEAGIDVIAGQSYSRTFIPGYRFTLEGHFRRDQNGDYLLTAVEHEAHQGHMYSASLTENEYYRNRFTCIPRAVAYRPPRITAAPMIPGPQTAFVTGPAGEEIYTEQYGRVKVQFHWDRQGSCDERSSCWVRVSQTLAGKGWGSVQLPRVGQEVIVEFLNGDPDRPLVTGRVYNAENMHPYELPSAKAQTTLKTLSYPGGGGFNELRFNDAKSKEQIFIHAQRNLDVRVLNDRFTTVLGNNSSITDKDDLVKVGGDQHVTVFGNQQLKVNGTVSVQSGADWQLKTTGNLAADVGNQLHFKAGANVVIECGTNLSLRVGNNFISIEPEGIFIKGNLVMINSGGVPGDGPGAAPATPRLPQEADTGKPSPRS
jgi:type VI secretion system secreted protein VgrG